MEGSDQAVAMRRCAECATAPHCLAADAQDDALRRLPGLLATSRVLQTGQHLFRAGDLADAHYYVRSGSFKTYTLTARGRERVTDFYLPGDVLSTTADRGYRVDSAVALETAMACRLSNSDVTKLEKLNCLPRYFAKQAARETRLFRHQLALANPSAQARFARYCVEYSQQLKLLGRCPTRLPLPMSRTDIASYLGLTLESLSRVTSKLSKLGVIRSMRTEFEVVEMDALFSLAGDQ